MMSNEAANPIDAAPGWPTPEGMLPVEEPAFPLATAATSQDVADINGWEHVDESPSSAAAGDRERPAKARPMSQGSRRPAADTLAQSIAVLVMTVIQRGIGFVRILFCRWLDAESLGQWTGAGNEPGADRRPVSWAFLGGILNIIARRCSCGCSSRTRCAAHAADRHALLVMEGAATGSRN